MTQTLIGEAIYDTNGQKYMVKKKLGEGSQGAVYETDSDQFIIKIIQVEPGKRKAWMDRFNWIMRQRIPASAKLVKPLALLEEPHTGYVMRQVKGHESLNRYIIPSTTMPLGEWYNNETGGLRKRIEIANLLSKSYRELHVHGTCYCDVSPNNVLVSRTQKSIAIIDPDNLTSTGVFNSSIIGTPRYIAPELYMEARQPSSITDTYSFAVILFELFRLGHPLLGDAIMDADPDVEQEALKGGVVYVDHPEDDSNRSSSILPANAVLTKELDELLARTFVDGMISQTKRPTLYEFASALQRAEDILIQCANEGCQAYFSVEENEAVCPWCEEKADQVLRFGLYLNNTLRDEAFDNGVVKIPDKVTGHVIVTNHPKAIYLRHIEPFVSQEADKPIAVVKRLANDRIVVLNNSGSDLVKFNVKTREQTKFKHREQMQLSSEERLIIKFSKDVGEMKSIFDNTTILNYGQLQLL